MILLNPGPTNTSEAVKRSLRFTDICPREREFGELMLGLARRIARIADDTDDTDDVVAVLFCGSGTAAVEAVLASAVPTEGRLLVVDNGAYGARMGAIAKAYGMTHDVLEFGIGEPVDLLDLATTLGTQRYTQLAVVHHETTTGMLNDVSAIGDLCAKHDTEMIVDGMSSFGAVPFTLRDANGAFVVASANKCLHGMPGLSFVVGHRSRIEAMQSPTGRSLYLNLGAQYRFFEKAGQMRFTPPVPVVYALDAALTEFEAGGQTPAEAVATRRANYDACFDALDGGMTELGFRHLLRDAHLSRILTAYVEPDDPQYTYEAMHDALHRRGFTIYPGKGAKVGTFRLSNMGAIVPEDMKRFIAAMTETVDELGIGPL